MPNEMDDCSLQYFLNQPISQFFYASERMHSRQEFDHWMHKRHLTQNRSSQLLVSLTHDCANSDKNLAAKLYKIVIIYNKKMNYNQRHSSQLTFICKQNWSDNFVQITAFRYNIMAFMTLMLKQTYNILWDMTIIWFLSCV